MFFSTKFQVENFLSSSPVGEKKKQGNLFWDHLYKQITAPLESPHHSNVIHMDHANKTNLSQYIIAMERLRVCYGRVPKLCTAGKLDQAEMWEGSRNKCFLLFPQASLLFSSLQPPECFGSLQHCKTPGLQQCQITSVAVALSITLHFHPVVLMSFTTTSSLLFILFFSHIRFSAQFTVQALQRFYTQDRVMQRQEETAGNIPASPVPALPIHTVPPSVSVTSNYAAA